MSSFPSALHAPVAVALQTAGDPTAIETVRTVTGGAINQAVRLTTARQSYLLKWNTDPLPDMFPVEERGLKLMAATQTVRVPAVLEAVNATADHPAYILLEWLEGPTRPSVSAAQARLGQQLAAMHQTTCESYGLDHHNYLGSTPQDNTPQTDWVVFFGEHRLRPQMDLSRRNGRLHGKRRQRLERLLDRLPEWLAGVERRPALLHGDLWGGNVIAGPDDAPALIDPAIYYGDREAEIAYTELFGGFSGHFYAGYEEVWPLDPGYPDRADLYNLYHLLNHLNLFGEGYGSQVDAVLRRYVG